MRRFFLSLSLCLLLLPGCRAEAATAKSAKPQLPVIYATSPWIASIASFIASQTLSVQSVTAWSANGRLRPVLRVPASAQVIALDPKDALRANFKSDRQGLHNLYENLPVSDVRRDSLFFDASTLPFISQRLLVVLCRIKPEQYNFYQRRLAEFQSRLDSTLEVGRSLLPKASVLDLTGSTGPWIRAALGDSVRPPDELWVAWEKGTRLEELDAAVAMARNRSWWIVTDVWTPDAVNKAAGDVRRITLRAPLKDEDFFTYLHDVYLEIWSAMTKAGAKR